MGHFSYLVTRQIGEDVNIGAGTITCNFDGVNKHKTVIEDGVFIGSDSMPGPPLASGAGEDGRGKRGDARCARRAQWRMVCR